MYKDNTLRNVLFVVAIVVVFALLANPRKPPAPNEVHGDLAGVITYLCEWKDECEGMAQSAQNSHKLFGLQKGQNLYLVALVAHNGVIEKIISALNMPAGSVETSDIQNALVDSDNSARTFCGWYGDNFQRTKKGRCESAAGEDNFTGIIGLILDAVKMQDQRDAEQRKALIKQLEDCRMKNWGNLNVEMGATG
jgi:hypothetical protein